MQAINDEQVPGSRVWTWFESKLTTARASFRARSWPCFLGQTMTKVFLYLSLRKKSQAAGQRKCSSSGVYFQVRFKIWVFAPGSNHDPSHASSLAGSKLRYRSWPCEADNSTLPSSRRSTEPAYMRIRTFLQLHNRGMHNITRAFTCTSHTHTHTNKQGSKEITVKQKYMNAVYWQLWADVNANIKLPSQIL